MQVLHAQQAGAAGVVIVECDVRNPLRLPHVRGCAGPVEDAPGAPLLEVPVPVFLLAAAAVCVCARARVRVRVYVNQSVHTHTQTCIYI